MIIFYDRNTKEITGVSMLLNDSSGNIKEPTLKSSFPVNPPKDINYFFTPNDAFIANQLWAYQLMFDTKGKPETIERKTPKLHIQMKTDAKDNDANGIPDIIANGKDQCTITASIRDTNGSLITHFNGKVTFKTNAGVLFDRDVECRNGVAKTTLKSTEETITSTITSHAEGCMEGKIDVDFVLETVFG